MTARLFLASGGAIGVMFLLLLLANTDTTDAGTFGPTIAITLEHTDPATPAGMVLDYRINANDVNLGGLVYFIPADFGIVRGDRIPIGEPVGELNATTTLGLINGACNQTLTVSFELLNATIDKSSTASSDDLKTEGPDLSAEGFSTENFAEDKDGNGLSDPIDHWPDFVDHLVGDLQPFRRSAGVSTIAGIPVLIQLLTYNPGTAFDLPGDDVDRLVPKDPALGFPTIVLLDNIGDPDLDPAPGTITDFCTPFRLSINTFGTNLDADRDGTSNRNDTCPYDPHPLMGTHDEDSDFLQTQCDPNDKGNQENPSQSGWNKDQDADGVDNLKDTCPLIVDEDQADADADFIGDACDEHPSEPDGLIDLLMLPLAGKYIVTVFTVGQRDADADSYQNSLDTCPLQINAGNPTVPGSGDVDHDGLDAACDPNDDPSGGGTNDDQDGDGYLNRQDNCPLIVNGREGGGDPGAQQRDEDFDRIGDVCDPAVLPDGDLTALVLTAEIVIGGGGAGGPPSNCTDCQPPGKDPAPDYEATLQNPSDGAMNHSGSNSGRIIWIVLLVAAVASVVGGGAALLIRRRG